MESRRSGRPTKPNRTAASAGETPVLPFGRGLHRGPMQSPHPILALVKILAATTTFRQSPPGTVYVDPRPGHRPGEGDAPARPRRLHFLSLASTASGSLFTDFSQPEQQRKKV